MTHNFPNDSPPLQINVCDPSEIKADTKGTSAKFKNTLQLRTGSYYFRGYIPLILASVVRSCIPKRQDHAEGQARQDAVEIFYHWEKNLQIPLAENSTIPTMRRVLF